MFGIQLDSILWNIAEKITRIILEQEVFGFLFIRVVFLNLLLVICVTYDVSMLRDWTSVCLVWRLTLNLM